MSTYSLYKLILWLCFAPSLNALGGDSFREREDAEAVLTQFGDITWPLLQRVANDPTTPAEPRRRARRALQAILRLDSRCPPLSLLSGRPLTEWALPEASYGVIGARPGAEWRLAWMRPDPHAPLAAVVRHYGDRARSQYTWRDWHSDADGREATRLLCTDLLRYGVPPALVRLLQERLYGAEQHCSRIAPPTFNQRMERLP